MKKAIIKRTVCAMLLIAFTLSMGLLAGCGSSAVTVPDVVGKTTADAEAALTEAGLTMNIQRERFSDKTPKGSIDKMITEAGTTVDKGSEVRVIASLGEGSQVPNVSVLTGREAENLIKAVGLNPVIVEEYSDEVEEGNIISYTDAGQTLAVGSDVTVTVSKGPKP